MCGREKISVWVREKVLGKEKRDYQCLVERGRKFVVERKGIISVWLRENQCVVERKGVIRVWLSVWLIEKGDCHCVVERKRIICV